jgi:hypothetical protein
LFKEGIALEITLVLSLPAAGKESTRVLHSFSTLSLLGYACLGFALTEMQTHCVWLYYHMPTIRICYHPTGSKAGACPIMDWNIHTYESK